MDEKLLQFIWARQYFDTSSLTTTDGEGVHVIDAGILNHHQGPDFSAARIRIGQTVWAGNVELHVRTGDWLRHGHQTDRRYENVILHVVWEHTGQVADSIPVLEMRGRIPALLMDKYRHWMGNKQSIPCQNELTRLGLLPGDAWRKSLVRQRLERKAEMILSYLGQLKGHWEEVFWWLVARNFGFSVNADAFGEMARSLPLNMISRHRHQIHQVEAFLLGQCGLLDSPFTDPYVLMLQKEYRHLRHKYRLTPIRTPVQFLRMRPCNFPTVRLAQLSMLIHGSNNLFARIREMSDIGDARKLFSVTANDFWHYHYRLEKSAAYAPKTLGQPMIGNILINTVIPSLFAYGMNLRDEECIRKSMDWLNASAAEDNAAIRIFLTGSGKSISAMDTQALLELRQHYCERKRCLECEIGRCLLSREKQ
jgi:hypothetical protein